MGCGKHSSREEIHPVMHIFVSTTYSTRKTAKRRTYQSIIGQSLVISGASWKRRRRPKSEAN